MLADPTAPPLRPPPALVPREGASGVLVTAVPVLGSVGAVALVATGAGGSAGRSWLAAGCFLLAAVGMVLVQLDRQRSQRRRQVEQLRAAYLAHLDDVRTALGTRAATDAQVARARFPDPGSLALLLDRPPAAGPRSEVVALDPRAVRAVRAARWGVGPAPLAERPTPPPEVPLDADPVCSAALDRLLRAAAADDAHPRVPLVVDLRQLPLLHVHGPGSDGAVRALVCSATATADPDALAVAVVAAGASRRRWSWVRWLPHARSPVATDAAGPRRLVVQDAAELDELVPEPGGRHVLVVVDGADGVPRDLASFARPGRTVVVVADDPGPGPEPPARLELGGGSGTPPDVLQVTLADGARAASYGWADRLTVPAAEAVARRLARLSPPGTGVRSATGFARLAGISDPWSFDAEAAWRHDAARPRLRVPIGTDAAGAPVELDLRQSAEGGHGPHGLVVGATGSGKSELLRTLVLGLVASHPPEELALVLVDFKGGATFADFADLPHTAALVTNLADEEVLVDRMDAALRGELVRRQEVLRAAGCSSLADLRRGPAAVEHDLPTLLVVVDEFGELLAARPDLLDLLVGIGRTGRSLGVHLLLSTQRLEEGRLRGLDAHLSYRVALRTFSEQESRAVLGGPEAHHLPSSPGAGWLRTGPAAPVRFTTAWSGAPVARVQADPGPRADVVPFSHERVPTDDAHDPLADGVGADEADGAPARPLLAVVVERIRGHGTPTRRVWLPPLERSCTVGDLLAHHDDGGTAGSRRLVLPIGEVDRPELQRREPLLVDLDRGSGHLAVVGTPRSGTTTALRAAVAAAAATWSPDDLHVLVLDLAGGGWTTWADLPHVRAVAVPTDPGAVRRAVAAAERHVAAVRDRPGSRPHRLLLVVDGWAGLHDAAWAADPDVAPEEEPRPGEGPGAHLEERLRRLAAHGAAHGVHLLVAAHRWAELRPTVRDLLGERLELRLGDPRDSELAARAAAQVPVGRPGRALVRGTSGTVHHALVARPTDPADDLVAGTVAAWPGRRAPRLPALPAEVRLHDLGGAVRGPSGDRPLLGLDRDLSPVTLDLAREPHLLVLGRSGSGRTTALRTVLRGLVAGADPARRQVVLVDPRGGLGGCVPPALLLHHLGTDDAAPVLGELAAYLRGRAARGGRAPDGPAPAEVVLVVDDHELLTAAGPDPLEPVRTLLTHAREAGLHLVLARRTGDGGRGLHEPVPRTLRDLGAPGLLLAGDPAEGPLLHGVRPGRGGPGRARLTTAGGTTVLQVARP